MFWNTISNWIIDGLRWIFYFLDSVVYGLVGIILHVIFDLSKLTTSTDLLGDVYSRIYVILGIFMAFKLSFSFIQYIIDPESMVGKSEKGVSKLITNTIIMIVALVGLPSILFGSNGGQGLLTRAQNAFLPMLPRLLLGIDESSGVSVGNGNNDEDIDDLAELFSITALQAFFTPTKELDEVCGAGTYEGTPAVTSFEQFGEYLTLKCNGVEGGKYFRYNYIFGVSTGVGLLICYILLSIGIDIGIRVFKMLILELVAPVPIMSLIDPKGHKDGAFSKWVHLLISTFLDIFIKLGILYLALTFIRLIVSNELFENWPEFSEQPFRASYLLLALIISLLFFVKEAPNFIREALGMKPDKGGFSLGKAGTLLGAGAAIGGGTLASIGAASTRIQNGENKGKAVLGAAGNSLASTLRAGAGIATGKKAADIRKAQATANQKVFEYANLGSTMSGRVGARMQRVFMGETYAEGVDTKLSNYDAVAKASGAIDDKLKKEAVTKGKGLLDGVSLTNTGGRSISLAGIKMSEVNAAMANSPGKNVTIGGQTFSKVEVATHMSELEDKAVDNYELSYTPGSDAELDNLVVAYDNARNDAKLNPASRPTDRTGRKAEKGFITRTRTNVSKYDKYKSSKSNTSAIGGGKGGKK